MTHTNLLLETPPSGQICALLRTTENRRQTANPKRIRLGMGSPTSQRRERISLFSRKRYAWGRVYTGAKNCQALRDWLLRLLHVGDEPLSILARQVENSVGLLLSRFEPFHLGLLRFEGIDGCG